MRCRGAAEGIDPPPILEVLDNAEYFDINNFILEYASYQADKKSAETGFLVRQFMVIDSGGIGMAHVSLRMFVRFKPIMPLADLYYPELLGGARVLNAAWALHQGWKLVKPLLSKQIQDMVGILGPGQSKDALIKVADPEEVPPFLAGSCKGPRQEGDGVYAKYPTEPAAEICPGEKLGKYMRSFLVPGGPPVVK